MQCTLYVLRETGEKLPVEHVRTNGRRGWIEVDRFRYGPVLSARFFRSKPEPALRYNELLELDCLELKIVRGGILLSGLEKIGDHKHARQTWWIVPAPDAATD